jgi:hypothetical protein
MASCYKVFMNVAALVFISLAAQACSPADPSNGQARVSPEASPGLTIDLPAAQSVQGRQSLSCRSLMEADLTGSRDGALTKGLEGKVTAGQNKVYVSIADAATLLFLSEAGFAAGTTRGAEFKIIANNDSELVAYLFDGASINSFTLNKTNGLAIWSKIRSTFPVYDAPTGSESHLVCQ